MSDPDQSSVSGQEKGYATDSFSHFKCGEYNACLSSLEMLEENHVNFFLKILDILLLWVYKTIHYINYHSYICTTLFTFLCNY
jgi:hypothetical protein